MFVDSKKIVTKLERKKESRLLEELYELNLKDRDSPNFVLDPTFTDMILDQNYMIYKSKVFYLFKQNPLANGILDMEELASKEYDED